MIMESEDGRAGRVLGVDPGTKRTGLAISDELGFTAQGLPTFERGGAKDLVAHIAAIAAAHGVDEVVVGLPLSMSGGDIEGSVRSRELAGLIERECGLKTVLRDERMTSLEAERVMRREGRIRSAADIDRLAAVLLLQGYLDERSGG
ncbi:MAG: Holliday junction resolvase RuvX [Candidatus Krumholzibacteria bacterium]|nr:Holliday junction resolvase RuvX [Candidatus Krumholzibacteria bacterium]